jgi:hypothetical protein
MDSTKLLISRFYFTASQNGTLWNNNWDLVLAKVLHTIQENLVYWLAVKGMR